MTSIGFSRKFDKDVSSVISEFLIEKSYKIKDCYSFDNLLKKLPNNKNNMNNFVYHLVNNPSPHAILYIKQLFDKIINNNIKIGNNGWEYLASSSHFSSSLENYFMLNFDNLREEVKKNLTYNSAAINIIKKHQDKINMDSLCFNTHPDIVYILEKNIDKINMRYLRHNKEAMLNENICNYIIGNYKNINEILFFQGDIIVNEFLQNILIDNDILGYELDQDNWYNLCYNPHPLVIKLIEQNIHIINSLENRGDCWMNLCGNDSAIHIIEKNINTIISFEDGTREECFFYILSNPLMIHIIEKNTDALNLLDDELWGYIFSNSTNIELIEKNLDKMRWKDLIVNKSAIHLIEKNLDKISVGIYENPNIFEFDSKKYKNDINLMTNKIYNLNFL
jgi:hypothetical protein